MTGAKKVVLLLLGGLAVLSLLGQLALGLVILNAKTDPRLMESFEKLTKSHQHTGYLTVALALAYILASMLVLARLPARKD